MIERRQCGDDWGVDAVDPGFDLAGDGLDHFRGVVDGAVATEAALANP